MNKLKFCNGVEPLTMKLERIDSKLQYNSISCGETVKIRRETVSIKEESIGRTSEQELFNENFQIKPRTEELKLKAQEHTNEMILEQELNSDPALLVAEQTIHVKTLRPDHVFQEPISTSVKVELVEGTSQCQLNNESTETNNYPITKKLNFGGMLDMEVYEENSEAEKLSQSLIKQEPEDETEMENVQSDCDSSKSSNECFKNMDPESVVPSTSRLISYEETIKIEAAHSKTNECKKIGNDKLQTRSRECSDKRSYICEICNKSFSSNQSLKIHVRLHSEERPSFPCEICNKSFSSIQSLKIHAVLHSGERPDYSCEICNKSFSSNQSLKIHMRSHSGERSYYSCELCNKSFHSNQSLKVHERSHTGERFSCEKCPKTYLSTWQLKIHMKSHTGERFPCEICDKTYQEMYQLKIHMESHANKQQYSCEICGKNYKCISGFRRHMRSHSGERFPCEVCDKSYQEKHKLGIHMKSHTGERPFACETCNKSFVTNYKLKMHMRSHTGERPHACEMCDKKYLDSYTLKVHVMKTHSAVKE